MEFSDLALAKFLQTAPELGQLILSFNEIENEEGNDDTLVGVFSLRLPGGGIAFVPVVGKVDSVFPIDSIYIEEIGFKPLSKAVIESMLSQSAEGPGKAKKIPDGVDKNPSVYGLINPPRTGKFVYASTSRLTEFLAVLPDHLKTLTFEKISSEKTVYDSLDKIFGLKTIFEVLAPKENTFAQSAGTKPTVNSVITGPRVIGEALAENVANDIVRRGFSVTAAPTSARVAVSYQPFNREGTFREVSSSVDGGGDYNVVMSSGASVSAFLPESHEQNPNGEDSIALFVDGNYAKAKRFVVSGDTPDRETILHELFNLSPPKLLKELERGDKFVMFSTSGQYLGPFEANSIVQNGLGVDIDCYGGISKICGYRNYTKEIDRIGKVLYVPYNVIVLTLGSNVSFDLEPSVNDAHSKKELSAVQLLGAELNLRYDGVEFSGNGQVWGTKAAAMKALVDGEGLDPVDAESFLKQAELVKSVKIFMSKQAASTDATPAEIPSYGVGASDPSKLVGLNGSFMPAVQEASRLGDGQVLEATIISQLLQIPDLYEYISEYLPEISETVDKLGRILFLTRTKIGQLSESMDPDGVFALISQIKNVYRLLGGSVEKLQGITQANQGFDPKQEVRQTNGSK